MQEKYNHILTQIKQVIAREDFMSLISSCNAPKDEYDHEALMIFERSNKYDSVDQIQDKLWEIFYIQFCFCVKYKIVDGELKEIGKSITPKEEAHKQIGSREKYKSAAIKIQKIWNA